MPDDIQAAVAASVFDEPVTVEPLPPPEPDMDFIAADAPIVAILEREGCPAERIAALRTVVGRLRGAGYATAFDVHGDITIQTGALPMDEAERIVAEFSEPLGGFEREYQRPGLPPLALKDMERAVARCMLKPRPPVRRPLSGASSPAGRNNKCPCGSGLKFKKCHGRAKR